MSPVVSVVCPTYQRSQLILPTLESVLNQTMADLELLVVSDGSTDDTDDVVRDVARNDSRVKLLRTTHHGHPSQPRNYGVSQATAPVVAYIDHDDVWVPEHLSSVVRLLGDDSPIVASGCHRVEDSLPMPVTRLGLLWHHEIQVVDPLFEPSRVVHRAGLIEPVGGWRWASTGLEDWDLWLRLADAGVRFATSAAMTVDVAMNAGSRRHRIDSRFHIVIARYAEAAAAEHAAAVLRSAEAAGRLRAAACADAFAWYDDLDRQGQLVWPAQFRDRDIATLVAEAFDGEEIASAEYSVMPVGTDFAVVVPLWCTNAHHAERASHVLRRRQPRQLREARLILADAASARRTISPSMNGVS